MSPRIVVAVVVFASLVGGPPVTGRGLDPTPLPEFEVTALDGSVVDGSRLRFGVTWLLVYVQQPDCPACVSILSILEREAAALSPSRLVVIVGGATPDELRAAKAAYPELPAGWFADPSRAAFARLELVGAPVSLGLRGGTIEWRLSGMLADAHHVRSILMSWLARPG